MEKYGVVTNEELVKAASQEGQPCPECGSTKVDYTGLTPLCPKCGTKPWEKKPGGRKK